MFRSSERSVRGYRLLPLVVLCASLAWGVVACGGEDVATDTTAGGATTLGDTMTSLEVTTTIETAEGVDSSLIGKWHSDQTGETFEFTADGRLIVTSGGDAVIEMGYTADGSNISYLIEGTAVYTGTYSVDGDVLSQVDPDIAGTVFFDRVE